MTDRSRRSLLQAEFDAPSEYRGGLNLWDTVGREDFLDLVDDPWGDDEQIPPEGRPRRYGTSALDYRYDHWDTYRSDPK